MLYSTTPVLFLFVELNFIFLYGKHIHKLSKNIVNIIALFVEVLQQGKAANVPFSLQSSSRPEEDKNII